MSLKKSLVACKNNITYKAGRAKLQIQKHDSEILLAAGLITAAGALYAAYKAGTKAEEIIESKKRRLANITEAKELAEQEPEVYTYDEEMVKADVRAVYVKTVVDYTKIFAPAVLLGVTSLACILTSKRLMDKKYLGVLSAYNGLSEIFKAYRKRVIDEQGEIMDRHFRYGTEVEEIEVVELDEKGKKVKRKELVEKPGTAEVTIDDDTSVVWDESNKKHWSNDRTIMASYLRGMENYATDLLRSRGHIMINEIYDCLGVPQKQSGCVIGWLKEECDEVDFGLDKGDQLNQFLDGDIDHLVLEFNHCGVIWDKI